VRDQAADWIGVQGRTALAASKRGLPQLTHGALPACKARLRGTGSPQPCTRETAFACRYLAAEKHLAAWAERNRLHQEELQSRLQQAALSCDISASLQIAKWVYQQTEKANGQVWLMEKALKHLSPVWQQYLSA
jgi:hypothetical protein